MEGKRTAPPLRSPLFCLLALLLLTSGCTQPVKTAPTPATPTTTSPTPQVKRLKVVTTVLPMYWFTKAVAGDAAEVSLLLPPGTDLHEYQSKPADVQAIAQANVLVQNGLGLEAFLQDTVRNAQNAKLTTINASRGIQPLQAVGTVVHPQSPDPGHDDHDHAAGNPHVWLDPILAKQQVETIRDGLIQVDPANQATYRTNAAAYIQQLTELDQQFRQRLGQYRDRTFVTFHDAFPYLARRYDLKQVAVVSVPEDNLSPGDIQATVNAVKQFKVKALLGEPGVNNKLLQSLSRDLNLTLQSLNSLESGDLNPQYYFTAMQQNLRTLETAFK